jgi:hypothetical protein
MLRVIGEAKNAYRVLFGKPEGKRLLGRNNSEKTILKWIF